MGLTIIRAIIARVATLKVDAFLPLDNGTRTRFPENPPQSVIDIARASYGQSPSGSIQASDIKDAELHLVPKLPIEVRKRIVGSRVEMFYCSSLNCMTTLLMISCSQLVMVLFAWLSRS